MTKKMAHAFCVLCCLIALLSMPSFAGAEAREKVILDTDMVEMFDDGVALLMLAKSPKVELLGVTCVTGNSWEEEGTAYTIRQMELAGIKNVPVFEGIKYPLRPQRHANFELERKQCGMGHDAWLGSLNLPEPASWDEAYQKLYKSKPALKPASQTAVQFIIDTVRKYPNEVTIAAIGPCTNLACAIRIAPDIVPLVKRVVYMGGSFFQQGNVTPSAEFNWWIDPEAAQITVRSAFKEQIIFGLDVCEKVVFKKEHYDRLLKSIGDNSLSQMLRNTFVGQSFAKNKDFTHYIWDVLVAAAIIDPSVITQERTCPIDINTQFGVSYGQSLAYVGKGPEGCQPARIVLDVNHDKVWDMINDKKYWTTPQEK